MISQVVIIVTMEAAESEVDLVSVTHLTVCHLGSETLRPAEQNIKPLPPLSLKTHPPLIAAR